MKYNVEFTEKDMRDKNLIDVDIETLEKSGYFDEKQIEGLKRMRPHSRTMMLLMKDDYQALITTTRTE